MPLTGQTDAIQTWGQGTLTITLGKRPPITLTAYRPIVERSMGKMGMVHLDLNRKP